MTHASRDSELPHNGRAASVSRDAGKDIERLGEAGPLPTATDVVGVVKVVGAIVRRIVVSITTGSVDTVADLAKEVKAGEPITHIVDQQVALAQSVLLRALGVTNGQAGYLPNGSSKRIGSDQDLRAVGNALLKESWRTEIKPRTAHPTFALMLTSLTADEARILRFLAVAGPQPAIDIRTKTPFGIGSERLAGGITLIAEMAGCSWPERDRHYLANLNRLGLVRLSAEPVTDRRRYAFVEAQPKATEPISRVKKARTVYRSIYLSVFGQQLCEVCFDLEGYDAGGWASDDRGDRILGKGPRRRRRSTKHQ